MQFNPGNNQLLMVFVIGAFLMIIYKVLNKGPDSGNKNIIITQISNSQINLITLLLASFIVAESWKLSEALGGSIGAGLTSFGVLSFGFIMSIVFPGRLMELLMVTLIYAKKGISGFYDFLGWSPDSIIGRLMEVWRVDTKDVEFSFKKFTLLVIFVLLSGGMTIWLPYMVLQETAFAYGPEQYRFMQDAVRETVHSIYGGYDIEAYYIDKYAKVPPATYTPALYLIPALTVGNVICSPVASSKIVFPLSLYVSVVSAETDF